MDSKEYNKNNVQRLIDKLGPIQESPIEFVECAANGRIGNIILNILLIGSFIFSLLTLPGGENPEKGIWAIVPLITIVLLSIANRLIKKDDNLVKSVDRFR